MSCDAFNHMSMGLGCGLRICLILAPAGLGLKGAWFPYGFGIGRSLSPVGRYAFGRCSAVVSFSELINYIIL